MFRNTGHLGKWIKLFFFEVLLLQFWNNHKRYLPFIDLPFRGFLLTEFEVAIFPDDEAQIP